MISFKTGSPHDIYMLSFSPDASVLAVGMEWQRTELREPTTGELLFAVDNGSGRNVLFWGGPNRRTVFVNRYSGGIARLDADEARVLPALPGWIGNGSACFTSDGGFGVNTRDHYRDATLACWKFRTDGFFPVWTRPVETNSLTTGRFVYCFLPDDDRFVYSERRGRWNEGLTLVIASRTDSTAVTVAPFPNQSIGYQGASPDGAWLALGAGSGPSIYVFRVEDLAEKPIRLTSETRKHYTGLAFHPSGQYLAATSNDETVTFFDTRTFSEVRTYTWKIGRLRSIAFSPDGALAAVGSDKGQVVVWDVDV